MVQFSPTIINDVSERSISHKLAVYLQDAFPEYHVDCEYNWQIDRYGDNVKNLLFTPEEEERFYPETQNESIKDKNAHSVYPDIIVHRRGDNEKNLLTFEIKKSTNKSKKAKELDKLKLERYKDKFEYRYSAFLQFSTGKDYTDAVTDGGTKCFYKLNLS